MKNYKRGDTITVITNAADSSHSCIKIISCRVVGVYPKFYVLDNGKYKFCGFKSDVHNKAVINV